MDAGTRQVMVDARAAIDVGDEPSPPAPARANAGVGEGLAHETGHVLPRSCRALAEDVRLADERLERLRPHAQRERRRLR